MTRRQAESEMVKYGACATILLNITITIPVMVSLIVLTNVWVGLILHWALGRALDYLLGRVETARDLALVPTLRARIHAACIIGDALRGAYKASAEKEAEASVRDSMVLNIVVATLQVFWLYTTLDRARVALVMSDEDYVKAREDEASC